MCYVLTQGVFYDQYEDLGFLKIAKVYSYKNTYKRSVINDGNNNVTARTLYTPFIKRLQTYLRDVKAVQVGKFFVYYDCHQNHKRTCKDRRNICLM